MLQCSFGRHEMAQLQKSGGEFIIFVRIFEALHSHEPSLGE